MQGAENWEAAYRGAELPHNQAAHEATGWVTADPGGPQQSAFRETIRVSRVPELLLYTAPMSYMGELRKLVGHRPLFSVGVSVVLLNERGEWLLQRRSDSGLWGLPGCGLEPGETFEAAAARELEEETGLTGVPLTEMMSLSGPEMRHVYPHGDEVYMVGMAFRGVLSAEQFAGATLGSDGETLELKFFSLDELPTLSGGIERLMARRLRAEAGLPNLPTLEYRSVPPAPEGNYFAGLRSVVGPRPLFAPGANVLVYDDQGLLLFLRHAATKFWTLPGGGLQLGGRDVCRLRSPRVARVCLTKRCIIFWYEQNRSHPGTVGKIGA